MTTGILTAATVLRQASEPDPGPEELTVFWPLLVQLGWFLAGFSAVVLIGWLVVQPVLRRAVRRRNRNNPTLQAAVVLYFRLLVVLVGTLVGVALAGYGELLGDSALVISAVALAVGIAAREVIGSLVSGVALVLDPEFNVGDHIKWNGGEGTVQSIALRITRVETAAGELVTIPNTILTAHEITRPYGRGNHRIVQELRVGYESDLDDVLYQLIEVADETEGILTDPPPAAYVDELGDDAVSVRVHYWITDPTRRDVFAVRSAYARAVKDRLEAEGINVSPPAERELSGRIRLSDPSERE
ncbi:mechanosensitive ion channel family protein [Halorubrum sp. AJ67]|uniref:mechanosensitive ion channel family protein n=1 Tax=Halorubrum sp. AJ67 TaxID=1173487 RepID=UPI0003DC930B|nr:mechanosensitive ion channel family protein [Halorubrum sp. AJ67]CDK38384.1 mscS Mechanosensitive ion channel [Halorubrum sp. AJ67]